ncbi:hypothetical protein EDF52_113137 [Curtobacterium sp. PhB42]|uniref:hypothetical protein n=1 Tax=unclassified Curtobacterium TaxID=257496 RepID=UPI00104BC75B|nr:MULTISPECIES: hypothetical protein [unclassified Curtobacterium]TCU82289.1 hypothetical protein EDF48_11241 [Curtobacterium sp. PhB191]TDW43183.1 hypothetical protein EDF52_113137 [Curtobacterium sp. PhB42]TDW53520.1 hypothetical protein EDF47_10932 [Curtobacterium sp. PhB190]
MSDLATLSTDEAALPVGDWEFPRLEPRGYVEPRRWPLKRTGYYGGPVKGAPSTSRQAEILNGAILESPMQFEGLLSGVETLSKTPSVNDPFQAYAMGKVDSANVVTIGDVGVGKSTLMKCDYVLRALTLLGRRVVVVDKKQISPTQPYGEYTTTAEAADGTRILLALGNPEGVTINILDPALWQTRDVPGIAGALQVLQQTATLLNEGTPLDTWELKALRIALQNGVRQAKDRGRVANIYDVLDHAGVISDELHKQLSPSALERMHEAGLTVRFILERLPEELPGLFDGDTSSSVKLGKKLTVFDISQLPEDGPAVSIAMMLANAWTLGTIRRSEEGWKTTFCVDEGWFLVGGPMGKVIQSNAKLSRNYGLSNVVNIHHISDIPADDPAVAFIKEAGTMHLFRQSKADDAVAAAQIAGLKPGAAEQLMTLPKGQHFKKVGLDAEVRIAHFRSELEKEITDTSAALTGTVTK